MRSIHSVRNYINVAALSVWQEICNILRIANDLQPTVIASFNVDLYSTVKKEINVKYITLNKARG